MMVAFLILAIVLTALAPAFYGSLRATAMTNARSAANGLAVAANEQIRSFPYYEVGFYTTPGTCHGSNPVTLPAAGPMDSLPTSSHVGLTNYTITRCVYWQSATTGATGAYKESIVTVGWTFNSQSYSMTQTSAVYPGGETSYAQSGADNNHFPAGTTTTTAPGPPLPPTGVAVSSTTTTSVTLSWSAPSGSATPVDHYEIDFTSNYPGSGPVDCAGCVWTYSTTPNSTQTVTGLTPGTTYWFQIRSIAADGTPGNATTPISGTTIAGGSGCAVYSLYVNPTQGVVDPSGHLINSNSFALWINATSPCSTQQLEIAYITQGSTLQMANVTQQGSGAYTGSAGTASTVWSVGNHQFTVYQGNNPYSPLIQVQVNVCQEQGSTGQC